MGEGRFERLPGPEKTEREAEVHLSDEEMGFFKEYGQGEGYKKSLAVARVLNAPHENIEIAEERQSNLRKVTGGFAESKTMPERAELGGKEYHTASIVAREFGKTIEGAKKEGLFKDGDVSIAVLDKGEHRWLDLKDYITRRKEGTGDLKVVATVASIEGDDKEGPTILIRNDMDALQMASGEIRHQCGHNVHSGWAVANAEGMARYKERFGELPFKRVIFVSEANEEANPGAGELVAPRELLEGGFEKRYGKVDMVLGAHVIATIPENTVRVEEGGAFHGATDYIYTAKPTKHFRPGEDNDIRLLPGEVARLVNEKYGSDKPLENFGKRQIVEDKGDVVPNVYVRTTAVQEAISMSGTQYDNLALNSLAAECKYEGEVKQGDISREEMQQIVDGKLEDWRKVGFDIEGRAEINEKTGRFMINIKAGEPAHVALGGPNPRQLMGEVLHEIARGKTIVSDEPVSGIKFGGTMRIRDVGHERVAHQVAEELERIVEQAKRNLGLGDKVTVGFETQNSVGPTVNDVDMARQAKSLMKRAGVESSEVNLPHAGAESFAEYERFLDGEKKKMLYIQVGGMKWEKAEHYLRSGEPVGMDCVHHSDTFRVQDSAMGYGVSLDALAIQYARDWKRQKII